MLKQTLFWSRTSVSPFSWSSDCSSTTVSHSEGKVRHWEGVKGVLGQEEREEWEKTEGWEETEGWKEVEGFEEVEGWCEEVEGWWEVVEGCEKVEGWWEVVEGCEEVEGWWEVVEGCEEVEGWWEVVERCEEVEGWCEEVDGCEEVVAKGRVGVASRLPVWLLGLSWEGVSSLEELAICSASVVEQDRH